eukprot:CAMPEP_0176103212 /NCGR_PEP_ID=MMETSP0120_2-20121206/51780_1 /TAXON_ID=160619 /ORGANISM="Kryptoperidinium foliaceum, Strain CCMP 1326" /LENGTH=230 /DNA_ID=CAMNT_0017437293 /DNA_START=84 /DNA_END=774 /DNA_ORIENTATION=+
MNTACLTCLVFLMCVAMAGIGPENEVAQFWDLLVGGTRGREQVMEHERVFCIMLLSTFVLQDWVPLEYEKRLATILFGPDLFGILLVLLFCLFDTSVDLYDYFESGAFPQRDASKKTEELLISATNLVLVVAHIKTFRLRYACQILAEQKDSAESALAEKEEQFLALQPGSTTLLGRSGKAEALRHVPHSPTEKKDLERRRRAASALRVAKEVRAAPGRAPESRGAQGAS